MQFQYLPIQQTQAGDVVQCFRASDGFTLNKLYIASAPYNFSGGYRSSSIGPGTIDVVQDDYNASNGWGEKCFKLVKTKPGTEAKVGDICIMTHNHFNHEGPKINTVFRVIERLTFSNVIMSDIPATFGDPTWGIHQELCRVIYSPSARITRTKPLPKV